jgi:hypothetical protein
MTTAPVAAPAPVPPATAAPTVAPPVVIDFGDTLSSIIANLEPVAAGAAQAGVAALSAAEPGLGIVIGIFGQGMVSQVVAGGATALENVFKGKSLSITPSNTLESYAVNYIASNWPSVASFLGGNLQSLITAEVAKIFPAK